MIYLHVEYLVRHKTILFLLLLFLMINGACLLVSWITPLLRVAKYRTSPKFRGHICSDTGICCYANDRGYRIGIASLRNLDYANLPLGKDYLLLTPAANLSVNAANITTVCRLGGLLEANGWLHAVSGSQNSRFSPICNVVRADWSLFLQHSFSEFRSSSPYLNGANHIKVSKIGLCYSCTVLPSPLLVRSTAVRNWIRESNVTYAEYGNGLQMALALYLNGSSAYCPSVSLLNSAALGYTNLTCNGLGSEWDQKFVLMHQVLKAYRLVKPNGEEAWLNCIFSFDSWNQSLPVACANWLYRELLDVVDILAKFGLDYRLVFGTVLGAIRDKDVIPWTADIDIVPLMSGKEYLEWIATYNSKIARISSMLYDYAALDGEPHLYPLRMIPRCPVIIDKDHRTPNDRMARIAAAFSSPSFKNSLGSWRSVPYVDIYSHRNLGAYREADVKTVLLADKFDIGHIRNRTFKLIINSMDHIKASYGEEWRQPPSYANNFTEYYD